MLIEISAAPRCISKLSFVLHYVIILPLFRQRKTERLNWRMRCNIVYDGPGNSQFPEGESQRTTPDFQGKIVENSFLTNMKNLLKGKVLLANVLQGSLMLNNWYEAADRLGCYRFFFGKKKNMINRWNLPFRRRSDGSFRPHIPLAVLS